MPPEVATFISRTKKIDPYVWPLHEDRVSSVYRRYYAAENNDT